jgi:hypothetical protein
MNSIVKRAIPVAARRPKPTAKAGVFAVRNLPRARRAKKRTDDVRRPAAIALAASTLTFVVFLLARRQRAKSDVEQQSSGASSAEPVNSPDSVPTQVPG